MVEIVGGIHELRQREANTIKGDTESKAPTDQYGTGENGQKAMVQTDTSRRPCGRPGGNEVFKEVARLPEVNGDPA